MTDTESEAALQALDEATVRGLCARFNDREAFFADPDGTWIERPRYRVYAQDLEMATREQVVAWFRELFDAVPDLHMEVEGVAIVGEPGRERATVRWRITGTFSGAPYLGIEPTGRPVDLRGMDLIDVEDGRVAANNVYYDQLTYTRQIGMLPPEGSLADRLMTGGSTSSRRGGPRSRSVTGAEPEPIGCAARSRQIVRPPSRGKPGSFDYPCVVARDGSGRLFDPGSENGKQLQLAANRGLGSSGHRTQSSVVSRRRGWRPAGRPDRGPRRCSPVGPRREGRRRRPSIDARRRSGSCPWRPRTGRGARRPP
jgi:ketosteroid isomerase-like protein